jgi:hypothetical protein
MTRLTDAFTSLTGRLAVKPVESAARALAAAQDIAGSALLEADAAGRDAVTLDDLLVAFALIGGPVGQVLAAQGLTAESLRAGIRERDASDLAALGITPPDAGESVTVPGRLDPKRSFRLDPEANRFLKKASGTPAGMFADLMDHPSRRPAAALRAAGADFHALRAALPPVGEDQVEDNAPAAPVPGLLDGLEETTRRAERWVPVSPEAVRAVVVGEESMKPLLLPGLDDVLVAPGLLSATVGGREQEYRRVRDAQVGEGHEVVWQMFWPGGAKPEQGDTDERGAYLHLLIRPADGGTLLTLTRGVRGIGRLGRIAGAATTVFAGSGNRSLLRGIVEQARARG